MISTEERQRILSELFEEVTGDLVGLWLLQMWVQRALGSDVDAETVRNTTLSLVDQAIESGIVVAGGFVGDAFEAWNGNVRDRIEGIWSDAHRDLAPTDNVWLSGRDLNYRTVK